MAIVFSQGIFLWADLLTDLTGAGTDDGITTKQIGWAEDQNNWYYCTATAASSSTWIALATGGGALGDAVEDTGATNPALMDASFAWQITDTEALTFEASDTTDIMVIAAAGGGDSVTFMAGSAAIAVTGNTISSTGGALTVDSSNAGSDVNLQTATGSGGAAGNVQILTGVGDGAGAGGGISGLTGVGGATGAGGTIQWITGSAGGGTAGAGDFTVTTGDGAGTGEGGDFLVSLGDGGATGTGGDLGFSAGDGGATSGQGGLVAITAGAAGNAAGSAGTSTLTGGAGGIATVPGGEATLQGGTGNTSGFGGTATVQGGTPGSSGIGGSVQIFAANGGASGGAGGTTQIESGDGVFSGTNGGSINIITGASVDATGASSQFIAGTTNAGIGGGLLLQASDGTTGGGVMTISSGSATVSGNPGNIRMLPGTGVDDEGYVDIDPDWTGDGSHYIQLSASGTNTANATQVFTGDRDPNTFVSGLPGSFYLRGDGVDSTAYVNISAGTTAGTDWTEVGGGISAWQEVNTQTTGTGAGSETFTLATPLAAVPVDSQNFVHFRIIGEDTTNPDTHTFFTRELKTYYRGAGALTNWTTEILGAEQNRGFGTEITSVDLTISGNAVIVELTMALSTRTIDWCVQFLTKDSVGAASSGTASTTGQVLTFDNRGAPLTTASAAGLGSVDFELDVSASYGELKYLRVKNASGTCADATIQFYYDAARTLVTGEIYEALNKDTSTTNGWVDRNPATMMGDDGTALESNTLYGTILNNDAGAATYDVELVFWSDGTVATASGALDFTGTKVTTYTASVGEHVKYDPSAVWTLSMPASASTNAQVGLKNVTASGATLTLSGNGNTVEDPASPGTTASSVSVIGAGVSLIYQFDGTDWWIV